MHKWCTFCGIFIRTCIVATSLQSDLFATVSRRRYICRCNSRALCLAFHLLALNFHLLYAFVSVKVIQFIHTCVSHNMHSHLHRNYKHTHTQYIGHNPILQNALYFVCLSTLIQKWKCRKKKNRHTENDMKEGKIASTRTQIGRFILFIVIFFS